MPGAWARKLQPGIARGLGTYKLAADARKKFGAVPPAPKRLEVARNVRVDRGAPFMPELDEFAAANKRIAQARADARRAAVERETRMVKYLEVMSEALERSEERAVAAEARADDAEAREAERRRVAERREWAMFVMTAAAVVHGPAVARSRPRSGPRLGTVPKRVHMFSDEGGDLTFKPPGNGLSRYFMIGTVAMKNCAGALALPRDRGTAARAPA